MTAVAFPFSVRDPFFMKEKPLDGPRNNPIDNVLARVPVVFRRIENAQRRENGRTLIAVNMLRLFTSSAQVGPDQRVEDGDFQMRVCKVPARKIFAGEIQNANAVGLADRPQRSVPDANPSRIRHKGKLRAFRPQPSILLFDRKRKHGINHPRGCSRA